MISSGRSFTRAPSSSGSGDEVCWSSRSRRPRTLASTRSEPAWRTMPPIRSGSTVRVASTLRPEARSIWPTICRASSSESSKAVVSSTVSCPSSRAASRSNSRGDLARPRPPRPFSTSSRRKLRTSWSRSPATASTAAAFARGRAAGCAGSPRARAPASSPRRSRRAPRGPRATRPASLRGLEERPRVGAVDDAQIRLLLQHGEVELADRVLDQAAVVVAVEHLAGHLRRGDQRQVGDLGADLLERALRLGLDLALRSPRAAAGGRPRSPRLTRSRWASDAAPRLGEDLLGLGPCACPISARCSSSSLRASSRARSASSIDWRIRSRRSSIAFWIGPNAYLLRTKNVIANATSVQIIRPGMTLISALAATISIRLRRGRRRAGRRSGRRRRRPR